MKNSQLGQLLLWIAQYSSDMPGLGRRVLFLLQYVPRYPNPMPAPALLPFLEKGANGDDAQRTAARIPMSTRMMRVQARHCGPATRD